MKCNVVNTKKVSVESSPCRSLPCEMCWEWICLLLTCVDYLLSQGRMNYFWWKACSLWCGTLFQTSSWKMVIIWWVWVMGESLETGEKKGLVLEGQGDDLTCLQLSFRCLHVCLINTYHMHNTHRRYLYIRVHTGRFFSPEVKTNPTFLYAHALIQIIPLVPSLTTQASFTFLVYMKHKLGFHCHRLFRIVFQSCVSYLFTTAVNHGRRGGNGSLQIFWHSSFLVCEKIRRLSH